MEVSFSAVDLSLKEVKPEGKKGDTNPKVKDPTPEDDEAIAEAVSQIEEELNNSSRQGNSFFSNLVTIAIVVAVIGMLLQFSGYSIFMR